MGDHHFGHFDNFGLYWLLRLAKVFPAKTGTQKTGRYRKGRIQPSAYQTFQRRRKINENRQNSSLKRVFTTRLRD